MSTHAKNIAIFGASGTLGSHIVNALLSAHRFAITAISRAESTAAFPDNVKVARGDISSSSFLESTLKNQDVLIIIPAFTASPSVQHDFIDAAAKVGVPWILPNEFGSDSSNPDFTAQLPFLETKMVARKRIEDLGVSRWIGIATNPWYDWAPALPFFGIDVQARTARLLDDGTTKAYLSTLPQVGRAVASLLSLPVTQGLERYANKFVFLRSFVVSQADMLTSIQKATGTNEAEWTVVKKPLDEEIQEGRDMLANGNYLGGLKMLYGLTFKDGLGNTLEPSANEVLGLKDEDLDAVTKGMLAN